MEVNKRVKLNLEKAVWVLFLFVCAFISTSLLMVIHTNAAHAAGGNIYYVSTSGSDNNAGTLSAPWRTIQKAANVLVPGDTVYVRGGTYKELVTIRVSGSSSGGYIQFQNYMGETPVIDGTGISLSSSNQSLVYLSKVSYIKFNGFELRNLTTSSSSLDPAAIRVVNSGNYIQLSNNHIHDIKNTASNGNAHGIHILGNSVTPITNLVVSGNDVHNLVTGWSESLTLSGNIDGFEVTHNTIHDNNNIGIELAGFYGACASPCMDQTRNGKVAENTVYHIDSSTNPAYGSGVHAAGGIYADGATNIEIEKNHVYANDFGIELASEKAGKKTSYIKVQNNYIHHNYGAGLLMGGARSTNGGSIENIVVNNTLVENDTLMQGYGDIDLQWNNVDDRIENNIIYSSSQKIPINKTNISGSGNVVDYNLFYTPNGMNASVWKWQGKTYTTWSSYKLATGNDAHSIFADPVFVDKANNNFKLQMNSPAIDIGLAQAIANPVNDFEGSARIQGVSIDIGAHEFSPTTPPVPDSTIIVDGNESDWSSIAVLSSGTSNVTVLKMKMDASNLNLLVQGNNLTTKNQIFINTDNNTTTGFNTPYWSSSGADYLLENGSLYRYSGTGGSNWGWTRVDNYNGAANYAITKTVLEVSIPFSSLAVEPDNIIKIGYILNDSNADKLPLSGPLLSN
jgi:hypothetical protein